MSECPWIESAGRKSDIIETKAELQVVCGSWVDRVLVDGCPISVKPSLLGRETRPFWDSVRTSGWPNGLFGRQFEVVHLCCGKAAAVEGVGWQAGVVNAGRNVAQAPCRRATIVANGQQNIDFRRFISFRECPELDMFDMDRSADRCRQGTTADLVSLFSRFDLPLRGGKAVLGGPESLEQNQECGGGKPGARERSGVSPNGQPMLPRPLYLALGTVLFVGGGWWSGRSLILGHAVGHVVGWLGGFIGTILLLLGLANLYVPVLP